MDIPGREKTKVGTCIRDEKPSLVQVACALRGMLDDVIRGVGESPGIRNLLEYAAQNIFVEGVSSEEPGIKRKVVKTAESVTTCAHSCAHHAKLMDIALWSGLPEELQELVFARLPWPQIYQVRILSKGWNQKLMRGAKDSQFKRVCARAQPKAFALLSLGYCPGSLTVNMFDIASNRWRTFETSLGNDPKCGEVKIKEVSDSDGGLVCFLCKMQSKSKKAPRLVFVCNPLTRVWKQLPPLSGVVQKKIMVQLIMDRETKHYRVIVVGYCKDPEVGNLVNVYHSETGQWTKADGSTSREVVYGCFYKSKSERFTSPCSYNFADGVVHEIDTIIPGNDARRSILVKDRLFCLMDIHAVGLPTHRIEEYQAVHCGASWLPLKEYTFCSWSQRFEPWEITHSTEFIACKDFLLVFVWNEYGGLNHRELYCLWLYEFSGEEWLELPMMPGGNHMFRAQQHMCDLRFDSVP